MKNTDEVAIFWDYENCPAPTNTSGYAVVNNIRSVAQSFGSVKLFKAYLEVTEQVHVSRALVLRSELQSSGVSLTDCPHNGRKDVADKMIIVDMLAHAIDNPAPSTIVLISGDRDFAYALSILRLRRYRVVLITLSHAHQSLRAQSSLCFDWISDILEPIDPTLLHQPTVPRHEKISLPTAHSSDPKSHNLSKYPFQESDDEQSATSVEFMNYFQDEMKCMKNSRTPPKHDFLPPDLEQSKRQPAASSMTSNALRNGPESPANVMHSPVASSYHTCKETPLAMTACDSNSSKTSLTPNTSPGSTPKLAVYGSIMPSRFSAHNDLQGSVSLLNLAQHEFATKTQSLSGIDQMGDDESDPILPPAHSDICPPPVTNSPSASAPSLIPPTPMSNATVSALSQSSDKPTNSFQPTSIPAVPENFKILIQCLQSHRSKGRLRPLRSPISSEIAHNGATYRQAGVLKFGQYAALAEKAGIIELGGSQANAWIALRAPWYDAPLS